MVWWCCAFAQLRRNIGPEVYQTLSGIIASQTRGLIRAWCGASRTIKMLRKNRDVFRDILGLLPQRPFLEKNLLEKQESDCY